MRLADFILENIEPILVEWEAFARSIWPEKETLVGAEAETGAAAAMPDVAEVRDDAEAILRATVQDMRAGQTAAQQAAKSKGEDDAGGDDVRMNRASESHGSGRVTSGFEMWAVVAEYRALRASVLRLWRESDPQPDLRDLEEITRFNESIDQSLTHAVRSYIVQVASERDALLANEKSTRLEAESAHRAKDMFLATLSHEMRTPLNAIVGWMRILRSVNCNEADREEGLDVIERNTHAQVQLINDILDVSRIVSGKLRVEIGPCELGDAVNAGVDSVRPAADARDITLDVQIDPSANRASCDSSRIQQVVWNLVNNAVKFTPRGGRVNVTLGREHSSMKITVNDNGQGISPELLPYVFDRFRQADSSARRRFGGLGLGLSIVKNLIEAHGGTVEAHSAGLGHGSTFTILLPIRAVRIAEDCAQLEMHEGTGGGGEGHAENVSAAHFPSVRLDGMRVLVVDDEADARRLLVKVLVGVGALVTPAASAAEALKALSNAQDRREEGGPDVLVSDLGMPDEDGFAFIREVRRRGHHARDLPAVALTAFVHDEEKRQALLAGFQVHLAKPVEPHDLTSAIARLAGRTR